MPPINSQQLARRVFNALYPESYWEKVQRICSSSKNRIARTTHSGEHKTTYVLELLAKDGPLFLPIVCKTLSMMEVLK